MDSGKQQMMNLDKIQDVERMSSLQLAEFSQLQKA